MITRINPFNIYNNYRPNFTAHKNKENYTASVSYENFSTEVLQDLLDEWDEEGLIEDGDSLFIMPQSHIKEASKIDRKLAATYPKAHLSKNGFAVTIMDEDGKIHTDALRYFDPRINTFLAVTHAMKTDQTYIVPIEEDYWD